MCPEIIWEFVLKKIEDAYSLVNFELSFANVIITEVTSFLDENEKEEIEELKNVYAINIQCNVILTYDSDDKVKYKI